jgi:hypothetical protein
MTGLVPGFATFSLGATGAAFGSLAQRLSIARVERDGVLQPRGIEIKGEETISGVRLILKYTSGIIRGSIRVINGELPANSRFSVRLNNEGTEAPGSYARRLPVVDTRGRFVMEGVADGTYQLIANVTITLPDGRIQTFSGKQQATILDGNIADITISIDMAGNP